MASDFWTRRKAGVTAEADAEQVALQAEVASREQAALEERSDEEILEELGLKDPDLLEPGDDFAAFLKAAVPERLRRRALRRLWLSNPALANLDALVDYGEDYTDAALVIENLQTSYQVGKGMLEHVKALAAAEEAEANPAPADEEDPDASADLPDTETADISDTTTLAEECPALETDTAPLPEQEAHTPSPAPRRMRFEFS
ncbi:DUF3306 domain-containing protein [Tropicimonas sp. TH_r6]|uniref:DUF3306 domain-containing protein n=1 Tax=Tropicimonas sp. TH_r6 TaxID=3082085 RepID=UPI002954F088|nr:DUF3306 domain-containing protein [Tropicimonas sp. TH_r6]MDV7144904.1 DUF3306 domain-containing protein [Tropicimonas sp. TH_r6]